MKYPALLLTLALIGCESTRSLPGSKSSPQAAAGSTTPAKESPKSSQTLPASAKKSSATPAGYLASTQAFPTGDEKTSAIRLEKIVPGEVAAGQPFEYQMRLTNLTGLALEGVLVREMCSEGFQVISSEPKALSAEGGRLTWNLGTLEAGAHRTIVVKASPKGESGSLTSCADVEYSSNLCTSIPIVTPRLALEMATVAEALACEEIPIEFKVTNSGSGVAREVVVMSQLPAGLTTADGQKTVNLKVPTLEPGKSKTFTVDAKATGPGTYKAIAEASMAGGVKAAPVERSVIVRQPKLQASGTAPQTMIIGRDGNWEFSVKNVGDGVARDAAFEVALPKSLTVVSSEPKAVVSGNKLRFDLGDLAPEAARTFTARLRAKDAGDGRVEGIAKAYCAEAAVATTQTGIKGIAAILLEVVDVEDPVLLGDEIVYEISVTNQGFAPDNNIEIVCTLDEGMSFVQGGGATAASVVGNVITLAPLAVLDAKKKAVWTLRVRAETQGDKRFKVSMTSAELGRPVEETEATNLYQ